MKRIVFFLSFFCVVSAVLAKPVLHVGDMIEFVNTDQSSIVKRISNNGETTAYVRVDITEMTAGGEELSAVSTITDGARDGLIASPSRLVIPAGGSYKPRLIFLGERTQERYFRVRFVPVLPTRTQGFDIGDAEIKDYEERLAAEMTVLTGYGTWVAVAPKEAQFNTTVNETVDAHVLRNAGNASVELKDIIVCVNKDKCAPPVKKILFPEQEYVLEKKSGMYYRFKLHESRKVQVMRLNS